MYEQLLIQAGLSKPEAEIYEILLREGELSASQINQKTPIKRGLVYKTLDFLEQKGLAERLETTKVAKFRPNHPEVLEKVIDKREAKLKKDRAVIDKLLPELVSDYTLSTSKSKIRFYEGYDGLTEFMDDSLKAKTEIYTYVDVEAVFKHIRTINENYMKKRRAAGKQKKNLVINSEFNRRYLAEAMKKIGKVTDMRILDYKEKNTDLVMNIYDEKVAYVILKPDRMVGLIIEDKYISKMHKLLFEFTWEKSKILELDKNGKLVF